MPHKMWMHNCEKLRGAKIGLPVEICPDCGQRGEYDGWHFSVVEHMGGYAQRTGLKPFGPHRALADKLLDPRFKTCKTCKGRGVIDINNGENWKECPSCHYKQYIFDGTEEERQEIRQEILKAFPDALPGTKSMQKEGASSGYTGGIFIRPKDNSPEALTETSKAIAQALGIKDTRKKTKHKSKTTSTGSTSSNMKITLSACNPHVRRIFETLVNDWKGARGTVLCIRPGRIYLKLNTNAHASGNSAKLPHNFNLLVLASPRGRRSAHIQVTWGLGKINDPSAYLDCIPKVVARFEKMTASLPGFEQKGSITRLMIDKQFKPLHTELLKDGMKEVKDAEAKAK